MTQTPSRAASRSMCSAARADSKKRTKNRRGCKKRRAISQLSQPRFSYLVCTTFGQKAGAQRQSLARPIACAFGESWRAAPERGNGRIAQRPPDKGKPEKASSHKVYFLTEAMYIKYWKDSSSSTVKILIFCEKNGCIAGNFGLEFQLYISKNGLSKSYTL